MLETPEILDAHDPGGKAKPKWREGAVITAKFSDCRRYRYGLRETWDENLPAVMFLMMNPSVANLDHADPTLIRTGTYARVWGFGSQFIGNIHAYRTTDKERLRFTNDPVGPENDATLLAMTSNCRMVVLAYGQPHRTLRPRGAAVVRMLHDAGANLAYLELSQDGTPKHPLYLKGDLLPQAYKVQA